MSFWRRTKKEPDFVTPGVERISQKLIVTTWNKVIRKKKHRMLRLRTYVKDPGPKIRKIIRKGETLLIRGLPGTGKTNLALYIYETIRLHFKTGLIHNNPGIDEGHFCNNWKAFDELLEELETKDYEIIVVLFDDVSLCFPARRAMSKKNVRLRNVFIEAKKKKFFLIAIEHEEKTADLDFTRFSRWVYQKPFKELPGRDAEVSLKEKKKVDVKRNNVFMWHTNRIPKCRTEFDPDIRGEWEVVEERKIKTTFKIGLEKKVEGLKYKLISDSLELELATATVLCLDRWVDPDLLALFIQWLDGEPQRALQVQSGIPQTTLSGKFTEIRERHIGEAFETVWALKFPEYIQGGSNTPEPDSVNEEAKIVFSLKCFADPKWNVAQAIKDIAKSELALMAQGYTLHLVILELFSKTMRVYHIERTNE